MNTTRYKFLHINKALKMILLIIGRGQDRHSAIWIKTTFLEWNFSIYIKELNNVYTL